MQLVCGRWGGFKKYPELSRRNSCGVFLIVPAVYKKSGAKCSCWKLFGRTLENFGGKEFLFWTVLGVRHAASWLSQNSVQTYWNLKSETITHFFLDIFTKQYMILYWAFVAWNWFASFQEKRLYAIFMHNYLTTTTTFTFLVGVTFLLFWFQCYMPLSVDLFEYIGTISHFWLFLLTPDCNNFKNDKQVIAHNMPGLFWPKLESNVTILRLWNQACSDAAVTCWDSNACRTIFFVNYYCHHMPSLLSFFSFSALFLLNILQYNGIGNRQKTPEILSLRHGAGCPDSCDFFFGRRGL